MPIPHSQYAECGTVTIDQEICHQCGQCVKVCPAKVLERVDHKVTPTGDSAFGCVACGHCMMVCPHGAIQVRGRGISPADLQPQPPADERATPSQFEALLLSRRSIRHYRDDEVALDLLQRVVAMASAAPIGIPPWDVGCVIVNGRPKVQELAAEIVKGYQGMLKMFRPWVLAAMRPFLGRPGYEQFRDFIIPLGQTYVDHAARGEDKLFYDAPALLLLHRSGYAEQADVMIAGTYAMLAAESLGLGSCIIGGAPPILQRNAALSRRFGIPAGNRAELALILGYPDEHYRRAIQREFTSVEVIA